LAAETTQSGAAENPPEQLTVEELRGLSPEEIVAAHEEGKLDALLGTEREESS
jgi:hypothetical protein